MRLLRLLLVLLALAALLAAAASAPARSPNPAERLAHLPLDPAAYDRAKGCLHRTQPGTRALEAWLEATRARGTSWGTESCRTIPVSRARIEEWRRCRRERKPGERCPTPRPAWSLHAEGRALDWHLDAANEADRAEAERLLDLLLAPDSTGAPNALARRMGLQEVIWNCRAWFAGGKGMRPYGVCFDAEGRRRSGVDRTLAHRDHVHFGLNWSGARRRTTYWR